MLHSAKELFAVTLSASDGDAGTIKDIYIDDREWTIRYLVVDTGGWISGRTVLISPHAITQKDWASQTLHAGLSRKQVEECPAVDTHMTLSRQHEKEYHDYYGYPYYWNGPYLWGYAPLPAVSPQDDAANESDPAAAERRDMQRNGGDSHLLSVSSISGYAMQAKHGEPVGHVEDFLYDGVDWSIRLLAIDTSAWWPGREVLIPPSLISHVDWEAKAFTASVSREEIENSQAYEHLFTPVRMSEQVYYRNFTGMQRW